MQREWPGIVSADCIDAPLPMHVLKQCLAMESLDGSKSLIKGQILAAVNAVIMLSTNCDPIGPAV